jgi:hypothetical protein
MEHTGFADANAVNAALEHCCRFDDEEKFNERLPRADLPRAGAVACAGAFMSPPGTPEVLDLRTPEMTLRSGRRTGGTPSPDVVILGSASGHRSPGSSVSRTLVSWSGSTSSSSSSSSSYR